MCVATTVVSRAYWMRIIRDCCEVFELMQGEAMKAGKRVKAPQSAGGKPGAGKGGKGAESGEVYKKWLKHNGSQAGRDAAAVGKGGASAFGSRHALCVQCCLTRWPASGRLCSTVLVPLIVA